MDTGTEHEIRQRRARADLEILRERAGDDATDIVAADQSRASSDVRYPAAVMDSMLAGDTPIAAWRKYRGISQDALAKAAGITQAAVSRLETTKLGSANPFGRMVTRGAIAAALDVPADALLPLDDHTTMERRGD